MLEVQFWSRMAVLLPYEAIMKSKWICASRWHLRGNLNVRRTYPDVEEGGGHSRQREQPSKTQTPVSTLHRGLWVSPLDQGSCLLLWTPGFWNSVFSKGSQPRRLLSHVLPQFLLANPRHFLLDCKVLIKITKWTTSHFLLIFNCHPNDACYWMCQISLALNFNSLWNWLHSVSFPQ